jgi:hypothetical protein
MNVALACVFSLALTDAFDCLAAESPQPIHSVWTGAQSCRGNTAQRLDRSPDQDKIVASGTVELAAAVRYRIPHVPKVDQFVLTLILNDRSRGVVDNYLLISDQDLKAPFGALVVTELPLANATQDAAFRSVDQLEHALARASEPLLQRREIKDSQLGAGIEYLVPYRVGSMCFPTSTFQFVPEAAGVRTMGASRFFLHQSKLIELSYVIELPAAVADADGPAYARAEMDRYTKEIALL